MLDLTCVHDDLNQCKTWSSLSISLLNRLLCPCRLLNRQLQKQSVIGTSKEKQLCKLIVLFPAILLAITEISLLGDAMKITLGLLSSRLILLAIFLAGKSDFLQHERWLKVVDAVHCFLQKNMLSTLLVQHSRYFQDDNLRFSWRSPNIVSFFWQNHGVLYLWA